MSKFINVEDLEKHKMKSGLAPGGGVAAGWNACIKYIQNEVPAADVSENKRGRWQPIQKGDSGYSAGDFACSCCGKPNRCYSLTDYCCNCGADMRGEKNG